MSQRLLCSTSLLAALACGACGDNAKSPDDGPGKTPAACIPSSPGDVPAPGVGLAVINGDQFSVMSVSLLDATGQVTHGDCFDSGTQPPGVTEALDGDVVLPSAPQPDHSVLLIDRFPKSVLTWLDPATCAPKYQLNVTTGFISNPHDVIAVSPTKAYVTRYGTNATPTADPDDHDEGDDLLIIDPSVPAITGSIPLSSYAIATPGAAMQARPDRGLLIDGTLYLTLNEISDDFGVYAHGRVLAIDTATDTVTATIDIPELADCVSLSYVAATRTLVTTCLGDFNADDPSHTSGLAYIDLTASPPVEVRHQMAAAFGGRPLGSYVGTADDGALGFGVTAGEFGTTPHDQLYSFDVATGQATALTTASDSFVYGTPLIDQGNRRMYLPDAFDTTPRLQVYDYSCSPPSLQTSIETDTTTHLPPRDIAWY